MELATKNRLATRMGYYWLWWGYLKLARDLSILDTKSYLKAFCKQLEKELKRTKKYYASWDLDKNQNFGVWWKEHKHLFEEKYVVREMKHGESPIDPEAVVIEVPLRFSVSILSRHTREIIGIAASKRGINTKSKIRSSAQFSMTSGAEPKYIALREMLTVYRDIQIKNLRLKLKNAQVKPLKGLELLETVNSFYKNRKNRARNKVPIPLVAQFERNPMKSGSAFLDSLDRDASSNAQRSLNRYIQKAEKIALNVAKGEFPGKY